MTLTGQQRTEMQAAAEAVMHDTCTIITVSDGSLDAHGHPAESTSESSAISCGFDPRGRTRTQGEETTGSLIVTVTDALVRVPKGTTVTKNDRVKLTKRYGVTLSPAVTYEVAGEPEEGPAAIVVPLKRIQA